MEFEETPYVQTVYRGREHTEVAVPLSEVLVNGKLDILDEVKGKKYFQIYSRGAELVFQCGGFVGLIPVNSRIAIEVAPRVNISNLDRILRKAGAQHVLLSVINRSYAASTETSYLIDLIADALITAISTILDWGKHKEYSSRTYSGHPRSGRILMKETFRLRAKAPASVVATTARFERTADNAINACIKLALERLSVILNADSLQANAKASRLSNLNIAWLSFGDIVYPGSVAHIVEEAARRLERRHELSEPYQNALPLALAILRGMGPSQRSMSPNFELGSLIFDMADAFEKYVRKCLTDYLSAVVLDGNLSGTNGAKKLLFSESNHRIAKNNFATPDVVISDGNRQHNLAVFDAKYKTYQGMPDREDINQALTYAVAYNCTICGLIYLSKDNTGQVERFGKVAGIEVVGISIALNSIDLASEEKRFAQSIAVLLALSEPAPPMPFQPLLPSTVEYQ